MNPVNFRSCSLICMIFTVSLVTGCSNFLFFPSKQHQIEPKDHGIVYKDVYIENAGQEKLHAWLLPEITQPHKGSIIFFHGNGENISSHIGAVYWLPQFGYRVLIVDYRGYGKSDGEATLDGAIDDVLLTIEFAAKNIVEDKPFFTMGQSIGASMLIYAATQSIYRDQIRAVLLVAPFSEYPKIVQEVLGRNWLTWLFQIPLSWTITDKYDPINFVGHISPIPVVLFHGTEDKLIEFKHSKLLYDVAQQPKQLISLQGGHNDVLSRRENLLKILDVINSLNPDI